MTISIGDALPPIMEADDQGPFGDPLSTSIIVGKRIRRTILIDGSCEE